MSNEIVSRERSVEEYVRELPSLEFPKCVDRSAYIIVPEKQRIIARKQMFNELQFHAAREQCAYQELQMSRIDVFIEHYCNVHDAALGKTELYDGNGKTIHKNEGEQLWECISMDCWTWLDAVFSRSVEGTMNMETDFKIRRVQQNGGILEQRSSRCVPLELPIVEKGYVSLLFNAQGMPLQRDTDQKYVRGKNMDFYSPIEGNVAGFGAYSDWASLSCDRDPTDLNSDLGVIVSAEGTNVRKKEPRSFNEYDIEIGEAPDEHYIGASSLAALLGKLEQGGKLAPDMRKLILRRAREK